MREVIVTADIPVTVDEVTTYATAPVILDQYIAPFQVSFLSSDDGTPEITFTDPFPVENQDFVEANFEWLSIDPAYPNGGNFLGLPVRAIRLASATQGTTFTVIQAGVK